MYRNPRHTMVKRQYR